MTEAHTNVKSLLHKMVESLCRQPDQIRITHEEGFILSVAAEDQGRCIGKQGATIWALATIVWYGCIAAALEPIRVTVEKKPKDNRPQLPFKADANWDRTKIRDLVDLMLKRCLKEYAAPFVIEEMDSSRATVNIQIEKYLQNPCLELSEALIKIIHAAGLNAGVILETKITWA